MELWQWHCRIPFHFSQFQKFFFYPPISAMPLPQLPKIYTLYFSNAIAANYFFFPPIFGNGIATIAKKIFFPSFGFPCALTLRAPTRAAGMGRRNRGHTVAENKKFLSPTSYLSLSNFCWISVMVLPQFILFSQITK